LTSGELSYDADSKTYHLNAKGPDGKPLAYQGTLDPAGKTLTLDREGTSDEGKERIILRPNSSKIRYTMVIERQPPGAPQYSRFIEVGVTKEGEAFAAGGNTANLPKCIITGGSATMTVSFQGKTFPICCTGCRDEFNDNPEKYVQKALLKAQASDGKPAAKPASSSKDDGAFDGLLIGEPKKAQPAPRAKTMTRATPSQAEPKPEADAPETPAPAKPPTVSKAASLLTQAQAFEKSGKAAAAVIYYRRIVREFPSAPEARTAAERIKAHEGK
jgi:YHS domain-containing protein